MSKNFAMLGVGGYVAPRHLKAINDTGNRLVAAADPFDSVGILDRFFPDAKFFTEIERFDRHLEKLRRRDEASQLHYMTVCSPNYLHDAHVRLALRLNAHAICEKPLVISPWNLDQLVELEEEHGRNVYTVLQLRLHKPLVELKAKLEEGGKRSKVDVDLTYITRRGQWYHHSWKGSQEKSGGLAMNIGIHFFDLLSWLFGDVEASEVHLHEPKRMAGALELEWARVRWFLSVDRDDLPQSCVEAGRPAFRSITIDGEELDFSSGFTDLHTRVYEDVLAGGGFRVKDAYPSISLVHAIRNAPVVSTKLGAHPILKRA